MHHYLNMLVAVLVMALFITVILKLHAADVKSTDVNAVAPIHKTCAYVDLHSGTTRTLEPGFVEFCIEGALNKLTADGRPSRLHLQPEPV